LLVRQKVTPHKKEKEKKGGEGGGGRGGGGGRSAHLMLSPYFSNIDDFDVKARSAWEKGECGGEKKDGEAHDGTEQHAGPRGSKTGPNDIVVRKPRKPKTQSGRRRRFLMAGGDGTKIGARSASGKLQHSAYSSDVLNGIKVEADIHISKFRGGNREVRKNRARTFFAGSISNI